MTTHSAVPKSAFWIIFCIVFLDLVGFGIVFPFLPLYARQYNLSEWQIGLVLGIYSLMQFIFAPFLGRLSDKIGRRPVLLVSLFGTALSFFLLAISKSFWWFLIARALDGIAGSNLATAQAYIADCSPKEQRTRNIGMWIGAAFGLGFAFGPAMGGLLQLAGDWLHFPSQIANFPLLAAGVLTLANWGFAVFKLPESLPLKDSAHAVGKRTASLERFKQVLSRNLGGLILAYAVVILAFSQMEATFSWLAHDVFKQTPMMVYGLFAYLGIVMAFVQGGLVRRLAPKLGDKNLALIGCVLMTLSLALIPLYHHLAWLMVFVGILAMGESFAQPALIAGISKNADDAMQGETLGVAQSLASLSRFLGPAMAGYLYLQYGPTIPYWTSAVLMALALGICWWGFQSVSTHPDLSPNAVS